MASNGVLGQNLFGTGQGPQRAPNTYPLWRYLLIGVLVAIGFVYAAPNLFPPDFALQITPDDSEATLSAGTRWAG